MISIDQSKKALNAFEQDSTFVVIVELSQKSWLVAGVVPEVDRHSLKKFDADENRLFALIDRWKQEVIEAKRQVKRIVVTFEAGRDGFWLARWLRVRGIEAHVIHPTSVSVSREHRRAKTDRLDTELLKRATLGWLRGEPDHCRMVAIRRWSKRMRSVRTASTSISLVSAPALSIASRRHSLAWSTQFQPEITQGVRAFASSGDACLADETPHEYRSSLLLMASL